MEGESPTLNLFPCTTQKKESFPLRISSVNVIKSAVSANLIQFTEEVLNRKLHFFPVMIRIFYMDRFDLCLKIPQKPQNEFQLHFLRKNFLNKYGKKKFLRIVFNMIQNEVPRSLDKSWNMKTNKEPGKVTRYSKNIKMVIKLIVTIEDA